MIFDWSGALADDFERTLEAVNRTLAHFGGDAIDPAALRREVGSKAALACASRLPSVAEAAVGERFSAEYERLAPHIELFPGVEPLLHVLRMREYRLFAVSSVDARLVTAVLGRCGLDGAFAAIHGDVRDRSAALQGILSEHDLAADATLLLTDVPADLELARAAGVRAGAALYGRTAAEELTAATPDHAFASAGELAGLLDRDFVQDRFPMVIPTVGGLIRQSDGRILLVRSRKWSGLFGLPGGKIDYGETMIAAYEREIREETGLRLSNTRLLMIQDCIEAPEFHRRRHFVLINYCSDAVNPDELVANYEFQETRWATPRQALDLPLNQPTDAAVREALRLGFVDPEAG